MKSGRLNRHGCARWLWLALAGWLLATAAQAGQVSVHAFLDRDHARLGDTVTLNIEVDGATQVPAPDVSALASDFAILGTSHNTSISIVNGRRSVKSLWAIGLRPLHAGTLTIPALTVDGHTTAPLTLTVGAAPATAQGGPGDPVFIQVEPSTLTPYVGQQIDLAVRLFYAPNVVGGSLSVPHAHGVNVRELGKGTRYQSERGGRIYAVLEKHYAVTAQRGGPLNLSPVTFTGNMVTVDRFNGFFGNGKTVTARSAPIRLAVRAPPAAAGKGDWLPARKLTLQLTGLPPGGRVQAGQPLTLTLTEKAVGLPFESLPTPRLPKLAGVDVYPDRPDDRTDNNGHWLEGTRTRKFALVPQHSGTLTIPAITLAWWNVKTNHKEVARIAADTLVVVGSTGAGNQGPTATTATPAPAASVPTPTPAPTLQPHATAAPAAAPVTSDRQLMWIVLGLWLATIVAALAFWSWWRRRRAVAHGGPPVHKPPSAHHLQRAFFEAARSGDTTAACEGLMAWARAERSGVHSLGELALALDSQAQREAIAALQRARFAGTTGQGVDADTLIAAFHRGLAWRKTASPSARDAALPPLYP